MAAIEESGKNSTLAGWEGILAFGPDDQPAGSSYGFQERVASHLNRFGKTKHVEEGWGDICEYAIADGDLTGIGGDVDGMDEVGGMSGVGRAIEVAHGFAVAVVGGDEELTTEGEDFFADFGDALVDGFAGFDGGIDDAGVTDHVGVGEVEDDEVVVAELVEDGFGDFGGGHFRFEVVGGDIFG